MTPREIDEYVHGRLAADGNLYTLHEQALADLQPDLILTQDLCAVCALPSGQVEAALAYLGCHARVLTLDPRMLDDVLDSILAVGQATGVPARAGRLVADLRARLAQVSARVVGQSRPKVAVVEWVDPPFTAGHWVPDLVTAAGGTPVAARAGEPSAQVNWAEIAAAAPDLPWWRPAATT
jgi:iron complex transport system substrate-binding protein